MSGRGSDTISSKLSFNDAHQIVGVTSKSFQCFWQFECEAIKDALVTMDTHQTGRVSLSKFYNTAFNSDRRFGESESFLLELGGLDATSRWLEPPMIIPNMSRLPRIESCLLRTT